MALEEKASGDAYIADKSDNMENDEEKIDIELDDSKAKFINGDAAPEAVVVIGSSSPKSDDFAGMGKEELLKYADDPYWVKVRLAVFILFWVAWFGMLAAAIVIIVLAPKCPPRPNLEWWQTGVMYQVYPQSFKDTDGNGLGDIKGIQEELPYLKELGVKSLVLAPIFKSAEFKEIGFDVTDFMDVDPSLGTIGCFEKLTKAAKKKRMKVILDFIPHSTSKTNKWFVESANAKDGKYADYYIWAAKDNGWKRKSGESMWVKDDTRGEFYLATLGPDRPNLNLKSANVQNEIKTIMSFWMDKGADGFRVLDVSSIAGDLSTATFKENSPLAYNLTRDWKALMNDYKQKTDKYRVLMVEPVGISNDTMKYYEQSDMSINRKLLKVDQSCNAVCVLSKVEGFIASLPSGKWANWLTGTVDTKRVATRMGKKEMVSAINTLLLTLPGTAIGYYGEEIGMSDVKNIVIPADDPFKLNQIADVANRYKSRTPMQWNSEANAGFTASNVTSWLPVANDSKKYNVKSEQASGSSIDFIDIFKQLTKLREKPSLMWGKFVPARVTADILSYVRQAEGHPGYLVAINFGKDSSTNDYTTAVSNLLPQEGITVFNSMNFDHDDFKIGQKIDLSNVLLNPGEAVIFEFPWSQE
ncbi:amino acid transporter heavy chain SLC3A1-like [Tubulanus polymorphus]|uniref:amino acid transporter heavy chain SLC3A1-like n=1 Tax=Tubulanus polymorphus TaxID=672921 RepID=UPI003DA24540